MYIVRYNMPCFSSVLFSRIEQMEDLEAKINEEFNSTKDKLAMIQINMVKFTKIDDLQADTEQKRNQLIMDQQALSDMKTELQAKVNALQMRCEELQVKFDLNKHAINIFSLHEN